MGQIITSLINFFLEVGRSGKQYKTQRNRSKALTIFMWAFFTMMAYVSIEGFGSAFSSKAEINKLRRENENLQYLKHENDALRVRNEIMANALTAYLSPKVIEQINKEKEYRDKYLPKEKPKDTKK